jgi:cytochrome c oxidase accessory protein FixG
MSALIDRHTLTVTYDTTRGEPRGRRQHGAAASKAGDCVDCAQCVTVCPTGIDIRNGIQLECINCTACMDACDDVMTRLGQPVGLIRITSHEAVRSGRATWLTTRVKAYATIWIVLLGSVVTLVASRADLDVLILRQPGTLYVEAENGAIANFYTVQVINRTSRTHSLEYSVIDPAGAVIEPLGQISESAPFGLIESRLLIKIPRALLKSAATPIQIEVRANGRQLERIESSLLGPAPGTQGVAR